MPIPVARIEPGIYVAYWNDVVSVEEIYTSTTQVMAMVRADAVPRHVIILDGTLNKQIPLDVRAMRSNIPKDRIGVLVVKSTALGRILGRMMATVVQTPIEFFETLDEAVVRGRAMLQES